MSNRFLALSTQDRTLAFDNAALTLHLNAVILEKDFWVSWLLGLLFAQPEPGAGICWRRCSGF